jgi:two-component system sensor histidine kinase QseC
MSNRPTIRRRLLFGLTAATVSVWGIVAVFVYTAAEIEVEEVFDATLAQEARVLATLLSHEVEEEEEIKQHLSNLLDELGTDSLERSPLLTRLAEKYLSTNEQEDYLTLLPRENSPGHLYEAKIAFLVRYADGRIMLRSPNAPIFDAISAGFHTMESANIPWRVFSLVAPSSGMQVQVSEQMEIRKETVRYILINSLWPMLLSLPVLGLIIWGSVGNSLRPLRRIAETVEKRDPGSLQPISTQDVPLEVVPMVEALNGLFQRVHGTLENERRFTANAAHELRTPLAALKTQAQAAQLSVENKDFIPVLTQIISGVDRTTHLLGQLLTLARADAQQRESVLQKQTDLHAVAVEVLSAIGELALDREIDLTLEGTDGPINVRGDKDSLSIMLRNLVDNAIRYSPPGGKVTVRLDRADTAVHLIVADTGKGVPAEMQEIMFQRFQRGEQNEAEGSGLGLSIVGQIAELHQATITMADRPDSSGLIVTISFPI